MLLNAPHATEPHWCKADAKRARLATLSRGNKPVGSITLVFCELMLASNRRVAHLCARKFPKAQNLSVYALTFVPRDQSIALSEGRGFLLG
jgi:hypothetical protein